MTREEKVQKIKEKLLEEIEKEKLHCLTKDGKFIDADACLTKFITIYLSSLYYIENYVNSNICFKDIYPNGKYILNDETLDILLQPSFDILNKIYCYIDISDSKINSINSSCFHISEFFNDRFFDDIVVSIIDRILFKDKED